MRYINPAFCAAALLAGTLLSARNTAVVISELSYHPATSEDDEFIELHNTSREPIDVSGWYFSDGVTFVFPAHTGIAPEGFLVVAKKKSVLSALHPDLDATIVLGDYADNIDNGGEELTLRDRDGKLVDRVACGDDDAWPGNPDGLGPSLERTDFVGDGEQQWTWRASIPAGGTPGARNSTLPGGPAEPTHDVEINEVSAGTGPASGFVELHNEGAAAADLAGYRLVDRPSGVAGYAFPAGTSLEPGAFLAVHGDLLPFAVANTAQWIGLVDADGNFIDGMRTRTRPAGRSYGRWPDGDGDMFVLDQPTGEAANRFTQDTRLVINELRYHPAFGHETEEYVELFNRGNEVLDLSGWALENAVHYTFPEGTVLVPGAYLVVSGDPAAVERAYGIVDVAGPWTGRLADSNEKLELLDPVGNRADVVNYADSGTWPPSDDVALTGPDGYGQSIELVNPDMESNHGSAWRASAGTPGTVNATFAADPPPVIRSPAHAPAQPRSTDSVTVTARVRDERGVGSVAVFYRVDGATSFTQTAMTKTGQASSDTYAAVLPAQASGTIMQFYLSATDSTGHSRTYPAAAPTPTLLYQVDDDAYAEGLPLYRLIMRAADLTTLATRAVTSDVLLDGTFVHKDDVYYNVGVRYRGENSRTSQTKGFRVQLTHDERFEGITRLNLNALDVQLAMVGLDFLRRADIPSPQTRPVAFVVNRLFAEAPPAASAIRYGGVYQRLEAIDEDFLSREFPGDDDGNLYRPVDTGSGSGNLDYLGEDNLDRYQARYIKASNTDANDYTDLIELTRVLNETPAADYVQAVEALLDVEEWVRYFAAELVLSNQDGQIATGVGEDYRLYRRFSDGRWLILPWDTNEVMYTNPAPNFFRMSSAAVLKLLRHPAFVTRYYGAVREFIDGPFAAEAMTPCIDVLRPYFGATRLDYMVNTFIPESRRLFLSRLVPDRLTIGVNAGGSTQLVRAADTWRFFRGSEEPPAGWAALAFDDATWEQGPGPIGYGDAGLGTTLGDMQDTYTTFYMRRRFTVAAPGAVGALTLSVNYDDAFVAYVNGTEVRRRNFTGDVTHTSIADASHDASGAVSFDITAFRNVLVAGENVLAVVGLNRAANSGDAQVSAALSADNSASGSGCFGRLLASGDPVSLAGEAPICYTAAVIVNGEAATYDATVGRWSHDAALQPTGGEVFVQALDWQGTLIASESALVETSNPFTPVGGTLATTTWTLAGSPYLVTGDLTIPAAATLTIEAGVRVFLADNASIIVRGRLDTAGTQGRPVAFQATACDKAWGALQFIGTAARGSLQNAEITYAQGATGAAGALTASQGAHVTLGGCAFGNLGCTAIAALDALTQLEAFDCVITGSPGAVACDAAFAHLERVRVERLLGAAVGIRLAGESNPRSVIRDCVLELEADVGILLSGASALVEGTAVHGMATSGIRCSGVSAPSIVRTLIRGCGEGLTCEDGVTATLSRCTITANALGLYLREATVGSGGGHAAADSLIVWGNGITASIDALSILGAEWSDIAGGYEGAGNRDFDPLFADEAQGDFRLHPLSPAIGAGKDGVDMGALPSAGPPVAPFTRGDTNADGRTDLSDAVTVLLHLFAGRSLPCLDACDANDDGLLNIADPVALLAHLFRSAGPLPAPYQFCAYDPTPDLLGCDGHAQCP